MEVLPRLWPMTFLGTRFFLHPGAWSSAVLQSLLLAQRIGQRPILDNRVLTFILAL